MRGYAGKVELVGFAGDHVRFIPAALAQAMVECGAAEIMHRNGAVRSIRLTAPASTHAERIGPPTGSALSGTRFTRWVYLDGCGVRIIEHHPRCLWDE